MAGYTVPMTVTRRRTSPIVRNRNDVVIVAGNDIIIAVTVYETETALVPSVISGASARFHLTPDGDDCQEVLAVDGVVMSANAGLMGFHLASGDTANLDGRHLFRIYFQFPAGGYMQVHGVMNIRASNVPIEGGEVVPGYAAGSLPTIEPATAWLYWNNGGCVCVSGSL